MKHAQHGVTLIEVLVTLVIISVGLLGVASLQSLSLRDGVSSHFNTRAQMATGDIIDRIMANKAEAADGNYAAAIPTTRPTPNCDAAGCSAGELVTHDLWQVFDSISGSRALPQSALTITYNEVLDADDELDYIEYSIALTWDDVGSGVSYTAPACSDGDAIATGCMYTVVRLQ